MESVMQGSGRDSHMEHTAQEHHWPSELLLHLSNILSLDGYAVYTWHKLAYLVCKNAEWVKKAQGMERPLLLTIEYGDGDEDRQFEFPFQNATVVRIEIDWGDGCVEKVLEVGDGSAFHEYKHPGVYHVKVFPVGDRAETGGVWLDHLGWYWMRDTSRLWRPLRSLDSLGTLGITSLMALFRKMASNIVDVSRLRTDKITDMSHTFADSSFNQPIGHWNVSNVTNMWCMFAGAKEFNQPIGMWNVSSVKTMSGTFHGATAFNQPIGDWSVGNVINMENMFSTAESFNQPIGEWDVSKVVTMLGMFQSAKSFNQPIGKWDVAKVRRMVCMFNHAAAFNQPLHTWRVSAWVDVTEMFDGAESFRQAVPWRK
jgi:surface protein